MNDDKLLQGIARAAREQAANDPLDERWDDLSAGKLTKDERRKLRAASADPQLAERAETAFRPLDADFRAQIVAAATGAGEARADEPPPDNVVPLPRRVLANHWALGLAASAVLALGVVMSTTMFRPGSGNTLPGYAYELRGTAASRSADPAANTVRADQTFELILTPATAIDGDARVRLFWDDGERLVALSGATVEIADTGAARVVAQASSLPLGEVTLIGVVSRGEWPDRAALAQPADEKWQALRIPVTVLPPK